MNSETDKTSELATAGGGWLVWTGRHPVLTFLAACLVMLLLAVSMSLVVEWRRIQARDFLRNDPRFEVSDSKFRPVSMLNWLPRSAILDFLLVEEDGTLEVKAPLTSADVAVINRLDSFDEVRFGPEGDVSDEDLRQIVQRQPLRFLYWSSAKTLSSETLRSIAASSTLREIGDLSGPFDQAMLDAMKRFGRFSFLQIEGPIQHGARPAFPLLNSLMWHNSNLSDDAFSSLMDRQSFAWLWLANTQLTEKSWPLLARFTGPILTIESPHIDPSIGRFISSSVGHVELRGGRLSDDAIAALMSGSRRDRSKLTARGLTSKSAQYLAASGVKDLQLFDAESVDDDWARELAKGPLLILHAENSKITVEGLRHLRSLTSLLLPGSQLTDQCIPVLNEMPNLRSVDLSNTAITDAGLDQLAPSSETKLNWIYLKGTQVTAAGVKRFLARHPDVELHYTPEPSTSR